MLAGQPRHAVVQQLESLHGAVVAEEVVAAVVAPVQLRGALQEAGDLGAFQLQRDRLQAAQLDLGVLLDHLLERQHEQARRVRTRQAAPAGDLHVVDERAERQHAVIGEVEPAIGPARAARRADHEAQHAVTPAAHRPLIAFGQQVVDCVDAIGVELQKWRLVFVADGPQHHEARRAVGRRRTAPEVRGEKAVQVRPAAAVGRIEQKVLEVHGDEFGRARELVTSPGCDR